MFLRASRHTRAKVLEGFHVSCVNNMSQKILTMSTVCSVTIVQVKSCISSRRYILHAEKVPRNPYHGNKHPGASRLYSTSRHIVHDSFTMTLVTTLLKERSRHAPSKRAVMRDRSNVCPSQNVSKFTSLAICTSCDDNHAFVERSQGRSRASTDVLAKPGQITRRETGYILWSISSPEPT